MKTKVQNNLGDTAKAMLRGLFIALSNYIRKEKNSQVNKINFLHNNQ